MTQANQLSHPKYRADIDGLRAIAVLFAVGFHAAPDIFKGGFVGVDIFFVISGFLISTIIFENLERGSFSFIEFYIRRIKRIFPALLVVLIASFTLGWFALLPDEYMQLGKHIASGSGFISNLILWSESGYFDNAAENKPLLHLWSLGIEEQFYIIWPLLLFFGWKKRFNFLLITLTVGALSFALNIKGIQTDTVATFYSPQTRFWELLIGSLLAWTTLYKQDLLSQPKSDSWLNRTTRCNAQSLLGATLIATAVLITTKNGLFPGWLALLPTMGTLLIISAGPQAWLNKIVLTKRILVWFGLISYPLYLWHWPLLSFARIAAGKVPSFETRILAIVIAVILAWLTYTLIEKPVRFGKHSRVKTVILVLLMGIMGSVGYSTYKYDGLRFRFPKIVQELTQYQYDYKKSYEEGTCFLRSDQDYTALISCKTQADAQKKTILIWGDSHAAHLYPGYNALLSKQFNINQRTASGCPPILGMDSSLNQHCRKLNDFIFESIKIYKPDTVVLAAAWSIYDWKKIEDTIVQLRKLGITQINLIGPVPEWLDGLPKQLFQYFKQDPFHKVPSRMNFGLNKNFFQLDLQMLDFSKKIGVNYMSPKSILCDKNGCITKLGESGDTLIAWDYGHLTSIGSQYLISHFLKN